MCTHEIMIMTGDRTEKDANIIEIGRSIRRMGMVRKDFRSVFANVFSTSIKDGACAILLRKNQ